MARRQGEVQDLSEVAMSPPEAIDRTEWVRAALERHEAGQHEETLLR